MAVRTGRFFIDIHNPEFVQFRDASGHRVFRERISIVPALPINASIGVQVSLAHIDIGTQAAVRLAAHSEAIGPNGFDLVIETWLDTKVYAVAVSWVAHTFD